MLATYNHSIHFGVFKESGMRPYASHGAKRTDERKWVFKINSILLSTPSRVVSFALGFFSRFCRLGLSSKLDQEKYRKYSVANGL